MLDRSIGMFVYDNSLSLARSLSCWHFSTRVTRTIPKLLHMQYYGWTRYDLGRFGTMHFLSITNQFLQILLCFSIHAKDISFIINNLQSLANHMNWWMSHCHCNLCVDVSQHEGEHNFSLTYSTSWLCMNWVEHVGMELYST